MSEFKLDFLETNTLCDPESLFMKTKNLQEKQYLLWPLVTQFSHEIVLFRDASSKSDFRLAYIFLTFIRTFMD